MQEIPASGVFSAMRMGRAVYAEVGRTVGIINRAIHMENTEAQNMARKIRNHERYNNDAAVGELYVQMLQDGGDAAVVLEGSKVDNSQSGEYNVNESVEQKPNLVNGIGQIHRTDGTHPFAAVKELNAEGDPVYATTRKDANIEAIDFSLLRRTRAEAASQYGLNEKEATSLSNYIQYTYGILSKRLREGSIDPLRDQPTVDRIVNALQHFPNYKGRVYRNLAFTNKSDCDLFLAEHANGRSVTMKAFTSTSKRPNGVPLFGGHIVHMVLDVNSGADIADTYGIPRQQEVILLPNTRLKVTAVKIANDGNPLIYAQEVPNEVQRILNDH